MTQKTPKHLKDFVYKCRTDIHFFAEHGFNYSPTWQQATILDQVQAAQFELPTPSPRLPSKRGPGEPAPGPYRDALEAFLAGSKDYHDFGPPASRQIADKSGQGPGKTSVTTIVKAFRALRSPGKSVLTAPTMRQCQEVWLSEFKKSAAKAHPFFRGAMDITATKVIFFGQKNWVILCITSTDDKKLQGMHDDGLTITCEEASGIQRIIIEQFQGTLSNHDCLLHLIGNPNTRDCAFFDAFNSQREDWQTYTLDAEETALHRPDIVNPARNERIAKEFGRNSDVYRIRVQGDFPISDPDSVMSSDDLEPCTRNSLTECAMFDLSRKVIAIDFARFGSDESVIYVRQGNAIIDQRIFVKREPAHVATAAFALQKELGWADADVWYVPDATGMGQGVLHMFYSARKNVFEYHSGGKAYDRGYFNRVAESWFDLAYKVKHEKVHLPQDNRLIQQLAGRKYKPTDKGQFRLESKEDYKRRLEESSPDRADACVMVFYDKYVSAGRSANKNAV